MNGDLKRYKTFIGSACKDLDRCLSRLYTKNYKVVREYSYQGSITIDVYYDFNVKSVALEDGNSNIVLGWDLSKCKAYAKISDDFSVYNIVYYLSHVLGKHKDAEYFNSLGVSSERKAIEEFKKFEYWKSVQDILDGFNSGNVQFTLADGEFPRQNNRKVLPIIIIDFDRGNITYYNRKRVYSYKDGRNNYSLYEARTRKGGFKDFIDHFIDIGCVPVSLVEVRNCPKDLLGNSGVVHL